LATQPSLISTGAASGTATFVFGTPIVVPQSGYAQIELVGNSTTYNGAPAGSEASTHSFQIIGYDASLTTGVSATSTESTTGPNGKTITLFRSLLAGITAVQPPAITSAAGVGNIDGEFGFGAGAGGDIYLQAIDVGQTLGAVATSGTKMTFQLVDVANPGVDLVTTSGTTTVTISGSTTSTVFLGGVTAATTTAAAGWDIPANSVHDLAFKLVSSSNTGAPTNSNGTYQLSITGLYWGDGSASTTGSNLNTLPAGLTYPIAGPVLSGLSD